MRNWNGSTFESAGFNQSRTNATCYNCHEAHYIYPKGSPNRNWWRLNLPYACGACHTGLPGGSGTGGQFPNIKGQWSRLEAQAKYTFDKNSVRMFGINGEAFAKLRYVWERNSVNNFDQDIMQPYMNGLINNAGFMTWMAFDNPNYNAHLMAASLGVKW